MLHSFHGTVKHEVPFKIFFYALSFYNDAVINTNSFQDLITFELTAFENKSRKGLVFFIYRKEKEEKTQIKEELLEKTQCINNTL